ncbi:MAG: hypothetical protein IKZ88_06430 [Neisseriaceae bacterium]|nr:hypothetical protein [Neisseriaceae bacterium]
MVRVRAIIAMLIAANAIFNTFMDKQSKSMQQIMLILVTVAFFILCIMVIPKIFA